MIGSFIPFAAAWEAITRNEARSYPVTKGNGQSGFERIHRGQVPEIKHTPKFKLPKDAAYFTIGSCFARNVERALISREMNVLNTECKIPGEYYAAKGPDNRNSALNAYNPHSMRDLLSYADREDWQTIGALQISEAEDVWADMLLSGLRLLTQGELLNVRTQLRSTYQLLPEADVFIMTLGYTESWRDDASGIFTNRSPAGARQTQRYGQSRFSFFNADAVSVIEAINASIATVRNKTNGRVRTILTVSPVPLSGTYSGMDVISANVYSKSTLVTAARQIASQHTDVDYFPSYEMVSLAKPEVAWKSDGAHVQPALVDAVIGRFVELYID
ncbi:GSCFA domain-containing protein [Aureimonas frigidaquae]|uniref:Putative GSCFA family protein n=1 Tax=Aureimonas frigidaquae TaxID=424757 RepID=A0A0P0Z2K7_9HYPH|nr:GSCFA domain-containing protein [Aureimonas frigidaquae]BAT28224.1 putative GSCFA family protein [Aureimonas frigidaquae]